MNKKEKIRLLLGVTAAVICGILYFYFSAAGGEETGEIITGSFSDALPAQTESSEDTVPADLKESGDSPGEVCIYICGAVKKPDVYRFEQEPRIVDVVKKAGGFTKKADRDAVNLAERVTDGMQLVIPVRGAGGQSGAKYREDTGSGENVQGGNISARVNINTASREELMTLSGIGESKADQILSYREENGRFEKIEDIMNISGIKEGVFAKIKDRIMTG